MTAIAEVRDTPRRLPADHPSRRQSAFGLVLHWPPSDTDTDNLRAAAGRSVNRMQDDSNPDVPPDYWPACGYHKLEVDARGWLRPTDDWLRGFLERPEMALVDESCRAERRLHRALQQAPGRKVAAAELDAIRDADARENYRLFLAFRDGVLAAGTLEAWLLQVFRSGRIVVPPLFIDLVIQALVRHGLEGSTDAWELRAAEMLFRPQRVTLHEGRVLAADRETLDLQHETQGLGELGRSLLQAQVPLKRLALQVLNEDNADRLRARAAQSAAGSAFLLDLTHEIERDIGHGVSFRLVNSRSGLKALARVLARWVGHLLGVTVRIEPLQRIDDPQWRWHVGLDAEASRLLDDLYEGREVEPERMQRLISLFKLSFDDPAQMRADVAGRPVYLAMATTADGSFRLKPQNLLLNLPLASPS